MSPAVLGVVPARGGSRGIPQKNLRPLAGRPLLAYVIDAARDSSCVDRLVLTTDSPEIAKLGRRLGYEVPFLRPAELATDEAAMQPTVEHAVAQIEAKGWRPDIVVVLQPTAPLRRGEHIRLALEILEQGAASSAVSVTEIPQHYAPQYAMRIDDGRLLPYLPEGSRIARRQDVEPAFSRDGTVYAVRRNVLMRDHDLYGSDCRPLILDASESLNLDSPADWIAAETRLNS